MVEFLTTWELNLSGTARSVSHSLGQPVPNRAEAQGTICSEQVNVHYDPKDFLRATQEGKQVRI
jgi:hypothetical protein